jgi:lysophospholipase L1-like esterase
MKIAALFMGMLAWGMGTAAIGFGAGTAALEVTGDWQVRVTCGEKSAVFDIEPSPRVQIKAERISSLPDLSPAMPPWAKGAKLADLAACECSYSGALDPASLRIYSANHQTFAPGHDYQAETFWGCVARLPGGTIPPKVPVFADYAYRQKRIDSVILTADGKLAFRKGVPHVGCPVPPASRPGERALANIWVTPQTVKLTDANLFPVLESAYPEPPKASPSEAERLIPKTFAKLSSGQPVTILAWGDSVTACGFLPDKDRWQAQFLRRLQERFPKARITLLTEAWGGRNTAAYRAEPPGSVHNYKEKVLGTKPDLIVSEFVNDAGMNQAAVDKIYGQERDEFKAIGAEWIILTPHYVRPDWMGLTVEKGIDADPRPYVAALRKFTAANGIALADTSLRWGRLWRRGIPYSTLFVNNINHPNAFGMSLFADTLMALFP